MDNEQKQGADRGDGWAHYQWSDEEVAAAVAYLKQRIPQDWSELEQLELTTGDLTDAPAADMEMGALSLEYKERFDYRDIVRLAGRVRMARRAALGLN